MNTIVITGFHMVSVGSSAAILPESGGKPTCPGCQFWKSPTLLNKLINAQHLDAKTH
jgi:hypothetical protein